MHMQVFHPVLKCDSLEAEDILLWKDAKQVHEVFRSEHGEPSESCRTGFCSMEQMLESNPSAFTQNRWLRLARPRTQ